MKTEPTVTEVARNFAAFINRVAYRGERFVLTRGGRPVAALEPVPTGTRLAELPALLARLPQLGPEEAAELEDELKRAREGLGEVATGDPWAS